ncbi:MULTISPECIES: sugar ABC transporter permease [unclassified Cryobacterium]|uniref:carbohydrate ABC transporter permease n=2 Tax=Cryobacterium TaxID=69578 RepID=UPI002AB33782|nr:MULTISPECIES: sugar ABC transporter permease [Cryobacterium]MDY7526366.1 sugar ABC transporter permease [Cryobacterium sp. 10C2]MDY7544454.1 sugar ABC transporter permease [Cryobacterium sp. 5B3]MDY7557830.1 sugar ABC transporter permease [Cryobacterium sp. 10C3]MEB0000302.1 sugar ABC transporter permease [Cryobacterium sp. RTS3]MEB0203348.1 sugar ABC transporter permease [Cryobacterium sp. 5I3]
MTVTTALKASSTAPRSSQRGPRWSLLRRKSAPYLFIFPFVAIFAAFSIYPLVFTFRLSLTNWRGSGTADWVGWGNYTYLLSNPDFWASLANSGVLWLLIIPAQLGVGVLAAVLLNSTRIRARGFYRTAFIVPFVTPLVAIAQIWIVLFDQRYGVINGLLNLVGLPDVGWLTTSEWSKPTLALLFLWKTTGFVVIIVISGLQSIDTTVYEAAELDGASPFRQLWSITVPLIRRTIMFIVVLQTLAVFQMFAEPYVVTKGGPYGSTTTAGLYLYNHITVADLGTGAANSFLLVIIVMALSLGFVRLLRAKD